MLAVAGEALRAGGWSSVAGFVRLALALTLAAGADPQPRRGLAAADDGRTACRRSPSPSSARARLCELKDCRRAQRYDAASPADPDTIFGGASLSKPVFAYARPAAGRCGRAVARRAACEQRAGLRAGRSASRQHHRAPGAEPHHRPAELAQRQAAAQDAFSPGERFSYSGEAFVWLQRAVEAKTGEPHRRATPSGWCSSPCGCAGRASCGGQNSTPTMPIRTTPTSCRPPRTSRRPPRPRGSLQTTAADYARFLLAVMSGARLKPATARLWLAAAGAAAAAVLPVHRLHRARGRPARRLGPRLGARARRRHVLPLGRCGALQELRHRLGGQALGRGGARQRRQRHGDHARRWSAS